MYYKQCLMKHRKFSINFPMHPIIEDKIEIKLVCITDKKKPDFFPEEK